MRDGWVAWPSFKRPRRFSAGVRENGSGKSPTGDINVDVAYSAICLPMRTVHRKERREQQQQRVRQFAETFARLRVEEPRRLDGEA